VIITSTPGLEKRGIRLIASKTDAFSPAAAFIDYSFHFISFAIESFDTFLAGVAEPAPRCLAKTLS
jgi:hypothetical protein